jgi:hypothetical protein
LTDAKIAKSYDLRARSTKAWFNAIIVVPSFLFGYFSPTYSNACFFSAAFGRWLSRT